MGTTLLSWKEVAMRRRFSARRESRREGTKVVCFHFSGKARSI